MVTFLENFDSLEPDGQADLTRQWLAQKPLELFAELRAERPILVSPIGVIVSKADDVRSVLNRGAELTVKLYADKMERITGPFMLGMDDTARYRQESSIMRVAFPEACLTGLSDLISTWAAENVAAAKCDGKMDVVSQLTRAVPTRFVNEYFGVPGPDADSLQRWTRTIFHDIFLNLANDDVIRQKADISAAEMTSYLDQFIDQQAEDPNTLGDNVLGRVLRMRAAPETAMKTEIIRHNLVGMLVGAIDTTSKATAYAIDWLLDNDQPRTQTIDAINSGDNDLFTRCVLEAMRFKPQSTTLIRLCEAETTLAVGKPWETTVTLGTLVFAATSSAMFDPESIPSPNEFRTDRSETMYFHFGHGQHSCFGRYINPIQIRELIRHVLLLPNLRRAEAPDGVLQHDGPFPSSLFVAFD